MMLNAAQVLPDCEPTANLDSWELLIGAILAEAAELQLQDAASWRRGFLRLAAKSPESSDDANASARLALRLAARLAEPSA
jgi:hypothetical protein